jgi:ABC-type uncharacterized transport system auxiliary subunit
MKPLNSDPFNRPIGPALAAVALLSVLAGSGCGYMVGGAHAPEVRTVHVPTFASDSFRRDMELQLTEAVQQQIQLRTPYRLAKAPQADTRLEGRIVSIDKRVENQNRFDDPRQLELAIGIEVRWVDARTGQILGAREFPVAAPLAQLMTQTSFAPESGQSLATATQQAVDQLARQIVGMMESPAW